MVMKLLLVSLEFAPPLFSGNGVYARSIARALQAHAPATLSLTVLTAVRDDATEPHPESIEGHSALCIPVPAASWGRLDRASGWAAFAAGAQASAPLLAALPTFDCILCVDWSGVHVVTALDAALQSSGRCPLSIPVVYLNFRVYSTSEALFTDEGCEGSEAAVAKQPGWGADGAFYRRMEHVAIRRSTVTVVLCRRDALSAAALGWGVDPLSGDPFDTATGHRVSPQCASEQVDTLYEAASYPRLHIAILPPPLRSDMQALAAAATAASAAVPKEPSGAASVPKEPSGAASSPAPPRSYLLSCVRLSPEKGALRFAEAVALLSGRGELRRRGLQPVLAGAVADAAYAREVTTALERCDPPALNYAGHFLGPADMARLYASAALNVHPATADAYGMSIVEAAAFGAPTLLQAVPGGAQPTPYFITNVTPPYALDTSCLATTLGEEGGGRISLRQLGVRLTAAAGALPSVGACDLLGSPSASGPLFPADWSASTSVEALAESMLAALDALPAAGAATAQATALQWSELSGTGPALAGLIVDCLKKN